MSDLSLPENVHILLSGTIHSVGGLELLLFLARTPEKSWRADEVATAIWPVSLTASSAAEYLELFRASGLLEVAPDNGLRYRPATAELDAAVKALRVSYTEKPVSVMRAIFAPAPPKIQSFANAFQIRKDPP